MKSGISPRYKAVGTATYCCCCVLPSPMKIIYIHREVLVTPLSEEAYSGVKENVFFRQKSQGLKSKQKPKNSSLDCALCLS